MDYKKETINTWNKLAELYRDKFMDMPIYNDTYDFFLKSLVKKDAALLEVGCGPGNISKYLISKNSLLKILGIDLAEDMVKMATGLVPECEFICLDATNIKTIKKKFDGIVAGFCIPYLSNDEVIKFIQDCYDMLNEDGLLYISYVDGKAEKSDWKTNNFGDRVYFHFHESNKLKTYINDSNFDLIKEFEIDYENQDKHQIIVARKR